MIYRKLYNTVESVVNLLKLCNFHLEKNLNLYIKYFG